MSQQIDLNELRRTVLQSQDLGEEAPSEVARTIVVTKEGELQLGRDLTAAQRRPLAVVQQDTFHSRSDDEARTVREQMPSNTKRHRTEDGVDGYVYSFLCSYRRKYTMFAYYDGSYYQVLVLEPAVEDKYCSPHTGHIYSDGRICFGLQHGNGRRSLADAYAKSVLWATGLSAMLLSKQETFPFSINNK